MHIILIDSTNELVMNLGETYLVTENGNERLGRQKLDLFHKSLVWTLVFFGLFCIKGL